MKSRISSPLQLLLAVCYLSSRVHAIAPGCNADNCYRAMFPSSDPARLSTAEAFCSTYTQSIASATTGFPTRFTSGCGTAPTRYSSACSCGPTATPTAAACATPSAAIVKNGGFECGLAPWVAQIVEDTSSYTVGPPGFESDNAFIATQGYPFTFTGQAQVRIIQNVTVVPGTQYILQLATNFNNGGAGFIGIMLNGYSIQVKTIDANDNPCCNIWSNNYLPFTSTVPVVEVKIEFLFGSAGSVVMIDDISIYPANGNTD